jgi:hypothetical protein
VKFFTTQWGFEAIDDVLARYMRVSSVVSVKLRLAGQTRITPRPPDQVFRMIRFSGVRKDVKLLLLLLSLLVTG